MKKILGISLVALFAAMPTIAGAANMADAPTVTDASSRLATVSYVHGAYDAAKAAVNTKQDQLKYGESNISSSVSSTVRTEGADNTTLVTEKAVRDAITSAAYDDTDLSGRVTGLETTVGNASSGLVKQVTDLNSTVNDATNGLVKKVADLQSAGYITKDVNDLTNYTTTTAMNTALDGKIDKTAIDTTLDGSSSDTDVASAKAAYEYANSAAAAALTSANNHADTELAKKINSDAIATTIDSNSTNAQVAGASAVYAAVEAAKTYADGLNNALSSTYATQSGVEKTIKAATYGLSSGAVSGNVIAMASWGSDTTTTISLQSGKVDNTAVTASAATYTAQ